MRSAEMGGKQKLGGNFAVIDGKKMEKMGQKVGNKEYKGRQHFGSKKN